MRYPGPSELPDEQKQVERRALRLERLSVAYWISLIIILYFVLGSSQAMKAAWIEDILALFPPIAFLVASRFRRRPPSGRFPYGYHRAITVAYVVSAVALFALGLYILIESINKLIEGVHPSIGMVELLDGQVWLGWLMIAALLYGLFPSLLLGRAKRPLADALHDKVLFADAKMNQADWLTAGAAIAGILGIGLGLWWADAVAAIIISLDIVHDGQKFLRESTSDLLDEAPKTADESKPHPLIAQVKDEVAAAPWLTEAAIRLREDGQVITGDVLVVPRHDEMTAHHAEQLAEQIDRLDWRLHGVIVCVATCIEGAPDELLVKADRGHRTPAR